METETVEINGTHYPVVEMGELSNSEIAQVERLSATGIGSLSDVLQPRGALFSAFALVIMRRTRPETTAKEASEIPFNTTKRLMGLMDDQGEDDADDDPKATGDSGEQTT